MGRQTTTRRKLLAIVGTGLVGSLTGCLFGGSSDSGSSAEEIDTDDKQTVVDVDEAIRARVKSVEHDPDEQIAIVVGAIDVSYEQEYRVRIGVIDDEGVVLAEAIDTTTLYDVGTNSHRVELDDIPDCEACHSGLLQVSYPEGDDPTVSEEDDQPESRQQNRNETSDDGGGE